MCAAQFYSHYPGSDLAQLAAAFITAHVASPALADAVILVPTRRASLSMRDALRAHTVGKTLLLPRIIALADIGEALVPLLGMDAMAMLTAMPPPMPAMQRHYLLTAQIMRFETARGGDCSLDHAMQMAEYLANLQDRCARAGVHLTREKLQQLFAQDYAQHWQQSLDFLNIVAEQWPQIEQAFGHSTQAAYEVACLEMLAQHWQQHPPAYPVFAVGSTASQPATAALLGVIAHLPQSAVILPGLDTRIDPQAWATLQESHPYVHLKRLLDSHGLQPRDVVMLGDAPAHASIWLRAMQAVESMPHWPQHPIAVAEYQHIRVIACHHAEDEARTIALLMREGLQHATARIALITPDEALMARVAAQLEAYGLVANRVHDGTLADTQAGSLLTALLEAIASPESTRALVQLLRHPLVCLGGSDAWPGWLDLFEAGARGVTRHRIGQMPHTVAALRDTPAYQQLHTLVAALATLASARLSASQWVARCLAMIDSLQVQPGQGYEAVRDALDQCASADMLERLDSHDVSSLIRHALDVPWRGPQFTAHPRVWMLTPVQARLQAFARVIFANMQDRIWPGMQSQSPWLNTHQQAQLGLPSTAHNDALIAHDILMHGSNGEVFFTYPERDNGSPVSRSRYLERLLTLLACQGVDATTIHAPHYRAWAMAAHSSARFEPELPPRPTPAARPTSLPVSLLDAMASDPFRIYARVILQLKPFEELDASPEPRDFGTIAHRTIEAFSHYWNTHSHAPDAATLQAMVRTALADFIDRPAIQLFWYQRLMAALDFINAHEQARRGAVTPEYEIAEEIPLAHGQNILLKGKIDRVEMTGEGIAVVDYKTGKPPTAADIKNGKALQLIAYAMLLIEQGQAVSTLEYWGLPAGKRDGAIVKLEWDEAQAQVLSEGLRRMLAEIMNPTTPLLARPIASSDRNDHDYDGISRYDEWAG